MLTRQRDLLIDELKLYQEKSEKLEKDQIGLAQDMSDKTLDQNELSL